jgi:NAD(P)H-flavin reductase
LTVMPPPTRVRLFRKALIVVTGSGIGPCLSLLASNARPPLRVLWQTRNPRKTYGDKILDAVAELDSDAVIVDTDEYGH